MESIGVSSFALNHNKKSSLTRLNMRLPSPNADIKPVAAKSLGDRPADNGTGPSRRLQFFCATSVSFIQLSNLSLLLANWSGVIEKRGELSAWQTVAPSRAMKLPLPSITSLEVKDAGKLRRRNRPAQLMTAVGHKREHRPVDGRVRDALARPLALTQHPTSLCGSAALPVQERLCCFPNRKEQRKMRMYLSSFKLGNRPEALQELVGGDRRAAIIMNALDNFPDQRAQWLQAQNDALIKLGFSVSELDLRAYFGKRSSRFYR